MGVPLTQAEIVDKLGGGQLPLTLVCLQGLPGSGKSTLARLLSERLGIPRFEADDYFMEDGVYRFNPAGLGEAHRQCRERVARSLYSGCSCIVSNTSLTDWELETYRDIAGAGGAQFLLVRMTGDYGSVHGVPDFAMERMRQKLADCKAVPDWIVR